MLQTRIVPSKPALILEGEKKNLIVTDIHIGFEASGSTAAEIQGAGAATRLGTLKKGEFAFFPYDYAGDIMIDSENNAATLEYFLFSRT